MTKALILPGLPRCATTAFVNVLSQHPDLSLGRQKEPHFFIPPSLRSKLYTLEHDGKQKSFDKLGFCLTKSEYCKNFEANSNYWIDASTLYSTHPASIDELAAFGFDSVRFIVMFRSSLERAWSHYKFSCSRGEEHRSFEEALKDESGNYSTEWLLRGYLGAGRIAPVVSEIQRVFGNESLYILDVDSCNIMAKNKLEEVLSFLGLTKFEFNTKVYSNGSEELKFGWLRRFRMFLRSFRQSNPILVDNMLTRWMFERFMKLAPKGDALELPSIDSDMMGEFLKVDLENQQVLSDWHSRRA